jgi:signal transduction histidine kinase
VEAAAEPPPVVTAHVQELDRRQLAAFHDADHLEPGTFLVLAVADHGQGMDASVRERAFDPFYSTKFLGRGLGLAVVSGAARRHGGAVRLSSPAGGGTIASLAVPLPTDR